jgi:hypothetical protein
VNGQSPAYSHTCFGEYVSAKNASAIDWHLSRNGKHINAGSGKGIPYLVNYSF